MGALLLLGLVVVALIGPQFAAQRVLRHYSVEQEHIPGSGGQLARHLLDRFDLPMIAVETTTSGDHYDPAARAVRLSADNYSNRSLTAIAVAAHEVGHALQDAADYAPLRWRSRLVVFAQWAEKAGAVAMLAVPLVFAVTRIPVAGAATLVTGLMILGLPVLVHLVTLPVEWDASFRRALPVLRAGRYVTVAEERAVRRILTVCALTYVAGSLASLINVWRWIAILRRA